MVRELRNSINDVSKHLFCLYVKWISSVDDKLFSETESIKYMYESTMLRPPTSVIVCRFKISIDVRVRDETTVGQERKKSEKRLVSFILFCERYLFDISKV